MSKKKRVSSVEDQVNNCPSSEEIEEKRYRNFVMLLYPEWGKEFEDILLDIKGSFKKYAYIKHMPEDKEKKEHVHLLLSVDNPRSVGSLSRRLLVPINLIQPCRSIRGSCRYLTHRDEDTKYQYSPEQVIVSKAFKSTFLQAYDDLMTDTDILDLIYNFIETNKNCDPIQLEVKLSQFVCENGYERVFKRFYNTICKYITFSTQ